MSRQSELWPSSAGIDDMKSRVASWNQTSESRTEISSIIRRSSTVMHACDRDKSDVEEQHQKNNVAAVSDPTRDWAEVGGDGDGGSRGAWKSEKDDGSTTTGGLSPNAPMIHHDASFGEAVHPIADLLKAALTKAASSTNYVLKQAQRSYVPSSSSQAKNPAPSDDQDFAFSHDACFNHNNPAIVGSINVKPFPPTTVNTSPQPMRNHRKSIVAFIGRGLGLRPPSSPLATPFATSSASTMHSSVDNRSARSTSVAGLSSIGKRFTSFSILALPEPSLVSQLNFDGRDARDNADDAGGRRRLSTVEDVSPVNPFAKFDEVDDVLDVDVPMADNVQPFRISPPRPTPGPGPGPVSSSSDDTTAAPGQTTFAPSSCSLYPSSGYTAVSPLHACGASPLKLSKKPPLPPVFDCFPDDVDSFSQPNPFLDFDKLGSHASTSVHRGTTQMEKQGESLASASASGLTPACAVMHTPRPVSAHPNNCLGAYGRIRHAQVQAMVTHESRASDGASGLALELGSEGWAGWGGEDEGVVRDGIWGGDGGHGEAGEGVVDEAVEEDEFEKDRQEPDVATTTGWTDGGLGSEPIRHFGKVDPSPSALGRCGAAAADEDDTPPLFDSESSGSECDCSPSGEAKRGCDPTSFGESRAYSAFAPPSPSTPEPPVLQMPRLMAKLDPPPPPRVNQRGQQSSPQLRAKSPHASDVGCSRFVSHVEVDNDDVSQPPPVPVAVLASNALGTEEDVPATRVQLRVRQFSMAGVGAGVSPTAAPATSTAASNATPAPKKWTTWIKDVPSYALHPALPTTYSTNLSPVRQVATPQLAPPRATAPAQVDTTLPHKALQKIFYVPVPSPRPSPSSDKSRVKLTHTSAASPLNANPAALAGTAVPSVVGKTAHNTLAASPAAYAHAVPTPPAAEMSSLAAVASWPGQSQPAEVDPLPLQPHPVSVPVSVPISVPNPQNATVKHKLSSNPRETFSKEPSKHLCQSKTRFHSEFHSESHEHFRGQNDDHVSALPEQPRLPATQNSGIANHTATTSFKSTSVSTSSSTVTYRYEVDIFEDLDGTPAASSPPKPSPAPSPSTSRASVLTRVPPPVPTPALAPRLAPTPHPAHTPAPVPTTLGPGAAAARSRSLSPVPVPATSTLQEPVAAPEQVKQRADEQLKQHAERKPRSLATYAKMLTVLEVPKHMLRERMTVDGVAAAAIDNFFAKLAEGGGVVESNHLSGSHSRPHGSHRSPHHPRSRPDSTESTHAGSSPTASPPRHSELSLQTRDTVGYADPTPVSALVFAVVAPAKGSPQRAASSRLGADKDALTSMNAVATTGALTSATLKPSPVLPRAEAIASKLLSSPLRPTDWALSPTSLSMARSAALADQQSSDTFEKYVRMLSMLLPDGAVRQKMLTNGLTLAEIDRFFEDRKKPKVDGAPTPSETASTTCSTSPSRIALPFGGVAAAHRRKEMDRSSVGEDSTPGHSSLGQPSKAASGSSAARLLALAPAVPSDVEVGEVSKMRSTPRLESGPPRMAVGDMFLSIRGGVALRSTSVITPPHSREPAVSHPLAGVGRTAAVAGTKPSRSPGTGVPSVPTNAFELICSGVQLRQVERQSSPSVGSIPVSQPQASQTRPTTLSLQDELKQAQLRFADRALASPSASPASVSSAYASSPKSPGFQLLNSLSPRAGGTFGRGVGGSTGVTFNPQQQSVQGMLAAAMRARRARGHMGTSEESTTNCSAASTDDFA